MSFNSNYRFLFIAFVLILSSINVLAQKRVATKPSPTPADQSSMVRSSAAFAEVVLRQTELESDIEELSTEYTEEYPKLKASRFELSALQIEFKKLFLVKANETSKLTVALGKIIVRKVALETDLWELRQKYADDHPDVKRAQRKLAVFEKAIKEVLQ